MYNNNIARLTSFEPSKARQARLMLTVSGVIAACAWSPAALAADAAPGAGASTDASVATAVDAVIVTGARRSTSEFQSLAPVQSVNAELISQTNKPDLRTALSALTPAYLASQTSNGSSSSKPVRTATLDGLGGDEILVLVNGHRRHNTSLLNNTGGSLAGAPVDLSFIPAGAISRLEVLTDGASAQYGSDAIAGAINLILKSARSGGDFSVQTGRYGPASAIGGLGKHGQTTIYSLNQAFPLGSDGGFLDLSAELRDVESSNVDGAEGKPTTQAATIYATPTKGTFTNPLETTTSRYRAMNEVVPWGLAGTFSYNAEYPLANGWTLYSHGTYGQNSLRSDGTYRNENNPASLIAATGNLGPYTSPTGGYIPVLDTQQKDFQVNAGVRGNDFLGWDWDFSVSGGRNKAEMYVNGINASFGGTTPYHSFYIGSLAASEVLADLDLNRTVQTPWFDSPANVAVGLEYRYNTFAEGAGEPNSYQNGGFVFPNSYPSAYLRGTGAGIGSPFMTGFTPAEAGSWNRNNQAGYIDINQAITDKLKVDLAGRYEHYSDFGGAASGKFSARYAFTPDFAIRGTVSNGFRAPSLAEQYTTVANQGPTNIAGQILQLNSYNSIRVTDPIAKALGATPLKPEKSLNFSLGFVAKPAPGLSVSLDAYKINITDRIGLTGTFNGLSNPGVAAALAAVGAAATNTVAYFTNLGDSTTYGLNAKVTYASDFDRWGTVDWTLSYGLNRQIFTKLKAQPAAFGTGPLFQTSALIAAEDGVPHSIAKAAADWRNGPWRAHLAGTYYSKSYLVSTANNNLFVNNPAYNSVAPPAFITDAAVSYEFARKVTLTMGADNIFNKEAPNLPAVAVPYNTSGFINPTPVATPYGIGGVFYYARVQVAW